MSKHRQTAWDLAKSHRPQGERKNKTTIAKPHQPKLKDHFPNVVAFVYLTRYVTATQVQARFPKVFACDRTCRRHLKQLTDLKYLATVDSVSTSPNWPLVYLCTKKGTQYIRDHFSWELSDAREEARTLPSLEHELFLTEFQLETRAFIKTRSDLETKREERRYFHTSKRLTYRYLEKQQAQSVTKTKHLIPDLGFLLKFTTPKAPRPVYLQYFVEMDNGTEMPSVFLAKLKTYHYWTISQEGSSYLLNLYHSFNVPDPKTNYRLLVITRRRSSTGSDQRRLADLIMPALDLPEVIRNRLWFTTVDTISHQPTTPTPLLSTPLWLRLADAQSWLGDFLTFASSLTDDKSQTKLKREYVMHQLERMQRHTCFPAR